MQRLAGLPRTWNSSSFCILGADTRGYLGSRACTSVLGLRRRRDAGGELSPEP